MKLVNIFNHNREITLFCRNDNGDLEIKVVKDFFPYFYEKSFDGNFKSYKGDNLQKMFVSRPRDIMKQRSNEAFEADILFSKRYIIDKIDKFEKTKIKYCFIDIEVQSDELPDVMKADKPISCISIYNSFSKEIKTFYLDDYESEFQMINEFVYYLKQEKFDVWLSWFVGFDYSYLYNRIPDFAQKISPISKTRYGNGEIYYPAGISIVDYLTLFKSFTLNKEKEYTLEYIAKKYLGKGKEYNKVDFSKVSEEIKNRNKEDVEIMVKLEKKFKLIPHYDEIRRFSMVEWEDLGKWNSRIIDMLGLKIAKKLNVILPMKPKDKIETNFEGAYREAYKTGTHFNKGKYDLSGAYMYTIIDLNIDSANIVEKIENNTIPINITDRKSRQIIETYNIKQNPNTILPLIAKLLIEEKNILKIKRNSLDPSTEDYKNISKKYNALKTIVLSAWGVMGNKYFRLYDYRVAGMITSIIRDLIWFVEEEVEKLGYAIEYVDTDGFIVDDKGKDISNLLNELVQKWAINRFNKKISITFDYEGNFEKLYIGAKCRYKGYLQTATGLKEETKGLEIKRKDSTRFMSKFQDEVLNKLMNKEPKKKIIQWIKNQIKEVRKAPIADIAFPCKLARKPEEYSSVPIFLRALNCTPNFSKKVGNAFYYIYMQSFGYEEKTKEVLFMEGKKLTASMLKKAWKSKYNEDILAKNTDADKKNELIKELIILGKVTSEKIKVKGKIKNVMAFDDDEFKHINRDNIDWKTMTNRNIYMKLITIFEAMKWNMGEVLDA